MIKKEEKEIQETFEELIYNFETSLRPLKNKERRLILSLTKETPLTISTIGKKLKINDQLLWRHIKILKEADMIKLDKKNKERGRPVYVSSYIDSNEQLMSLKALLEISLEEIQRLEKKQKKNRKRKK